MTAKIKLNAASGGGSASIQAPASSSNDRVYTLPDTAHISTLGGISECDQWYLTADVTSTQNITANLTRNLGQSGTGAAPLGTGMTESSGVFSFPSTGKYMIIVHARFSIAGTDSCNIATQLSVDGGSNWITSAYASDGNNSSGGANRDGASTSLFFFDVTDVSQRKARFNAGSIGTSSLVRGNATIVQTSFTFIRIGDT